MRSVLLCNVIGIWLLGGTYLPAKAGSSIGLSSNRFDPVVEPIKPGEPRGQSDPNKPGGPRGQVDPNKPGGPRGQVDPNKPGGPRKPPADKASIDPNKPGGPRHEDLLSGKYEGVAKSDQLGDIPLTVEIRNDNGKVSGRIDSPQGPAAISGGTFDNAKIVLKFDAGGSEGTVTAVFDGDKITGRWELGGQGGILELRRASMATNAPAASAAPKPVAGDSLTGEWGASADAQGTSIPFTLKLKLDGDQVTGSSESAQGWVPISKGSWVENKLTFSLETPNGAIGMTAILKDGKLVGEFDFAGQMTGKWEATKKK